MSKDTFPSIFSLQLGVIVSIILQFFFRSHAIGLNALRNWIYSLAKTGEHPSDSPRIFKNARILKKI